MTPAPKPAPKPVKPRKGIPRKTYLKKSDKPIRKVNPEALAKRKKREAKDHRSKETRAVFAEAMLRAGGRCEWEVDVDTYACNGWLWITTRCEATEKLEHHHLSYPKGRKLRASDIKILCDFHHNYVESLKPARRRVG